MLPCGQVELETNSGCWLPWQVDKLPGHVVVSRRDPASITPERNGWPLARVCAAVVEQCWQGNHPEVREAWCPHCYRRRSNCLSAGHAGDGCDVELEIVHERQQVRSVGWLDSMHLKAAPFDGLIQEPVII